MARRARRSSGLSDGLSGLLLGLAGIILLGALGAGYWYVKGNRVALDPQSNCPKTGPKEIHVILFDRSDPISEQQSQRIRQAIDRYKNDASFGTRFDVYTFQGDTQHSLQPRLQVCALGKPAEANALIENPEAVRRAYETKFSAVLDQTITELLRGSQEKNSPIIESLRAAAISSFGPVEAGQIPLRLTMISDMVQNTALANQFQAEPNFQQLSKTAAWPTLQPQLKGADVNILYLLRLSAVRKGAPIQTRGHQLFWEQLILASGGTIFEYRPIVRASTWKLTLAMTIRLPEVKMKLASIVHCITLPRRRFFSDMPDKGLFAAVAVFGFGAILFLKVRGINSDAVAAGAVTLMIVYGFVAFQYRRVRMRPDRLGDNFYYLGFIFTLASLSAALLQLRGGAHIEELLGAFGIALFTTIIGVAGRVLFVQLRGDIDEVEDEVRRDLLSTSADLRAQLNITLAEFETFHTGVQQASRQAAEQSIAAAETAISNISRVANAAAENIERAFDREADKLEVFAQTTSRIETGLKNLTVEVSDRVQDMSESLDRMVEQLREVTNLNRRKRRRITLWPFGKK